MAWARVAAKGAAEAAGAAKLGDEARALLREGLAPADYLALLEARGLHRDGVHFLASALPRREALWWACQCLRPTAGAAAGQAAALEAVERYVRLPTDSNRRAAFAAAEAAGIDTPAGCAGLAAFTSAGSLAPADGPAVPPADHLTAVGVANALVLAAVAPRPQEAPEKFARFLALGRAVAEGTSRWPSPE
jgi:hypothetical protein